MTDQTSIPSKAEFAKSTEAALAAMDEIEWQIVELINMYHEITAGSDGPTIPGYRPIGNDNTDMLRNVTDL